MGNSSKKPEDFEVVSSYKREEWINKEKNGKCEVWENPSHNIRADVYPQHEAISTHELENY